MRRKAEVKQEQEISIVIKCGRLREVIDSWRFYEIVNAVMQNGMSVTEARDVALWARKATAGEQWLNPLLDIRATEKTIE